MPAEILEVDLGERSYPIYIGAGLLGDAELLLRHVPRGRIAVVSNATVAPLYLERVRAGRSYLRRWRRGRDACMQRRRSRDLE